MPSVLQSPPHTPNKPQLAPNVKNVVLGDIQIRPWYPSFYPKDQLGTEKVNQLFVCHWCFKYTTEIADYGKHLSCCPLKEQEAIGHKVYEQAGYAIYEVDGEEHKLYAQNLSLFAKLFLDTKSVFFDVSSFLYYTLVSKQPTEYNQVVGFFSKEKMSWDNNNVACILVFPPWQGKGLGQILMGASYELGRQEGRFGGPERPLSALGRKGYTLYWCGEVCRYLLAAKKGSVTIKAVSESTWILPDDVVTALKEMNICEGRKTAAGNIVINKSKTRSWAESHSIPALPPVDRDAFRPGMYGYSNHDSREDSE